MREGRRGGTGDASGRKLGLLSAGVTHSAYRRIAAGTYLRTFIVYELQFRDGSGLIQFNGVPGELYARRHLVPRSACKYAHVYVYAPVSMCMRGPPRCISGPRREREGGEGH